VDTPRKSVMHEQTVTFLAIGYHCHLTDTKLYCSVTEVREYEQLVQGHYQTVEKPGVKPMTS